MSRTNRVKFCIVFFPIFLLIFATVSESKDSSSPLILLKVDATEAPQKIFHAKLVIPVKPGPLTLLYPKWIPGEHSPTGPIRDVTGLQIVADGKNLPWQRDLVDMYAVHCEIPKSTNTVEVSLDYLSPAKQEGFSSTASATSQLTVISWNQLLLYPQGQPNSEITFAASLKLPAGWKYGTALPLQRESEEAIQFAPVSLVTLIDSPVLAGLNFRTIDLAPNNQLHMAADSMSALEMSPESMAHYKQLTAEAEALFGAHHFQNYHFLLTLSDYVAHFGLEHHESSDNRVHEQMLLNENLRKRYASLLPHEFVHSWNGKYRRPAGLVIPDYQQPMKDDLLWVYEGLTNYLGQVLTARSGLWTPEQYRENLARMAANLDFQAGRNWRPLIDTAVAAQLLYEAPDEWRIRRRSTDFYDESSLLWLEADTIIRQQTQGTRSLDDFCRQFHGGPSGPPTVKTYTLEDVVAGLNSVTAYDWRTFLSTRLNLIQPHPPMAGIEQSGWRLVYNETPNELISAGEYERKTIDHRFSIGLILKEDGIVEDIVPGSAAAKAGIAPGMKLIGVNGRKFQTDILKEAIHLTKDSSKSLELLLENADFYITCRLDYSGGLRYPHLDQDSSKPNTLERSIQSLTRP